MCSIECRTSKTKRNAFYEYKARDCCMLSSYRRTLYCVLGESVKGLDFGDINAGHVMPLARFGVPLAIFLR